MIFERKTSVLFVFSVLFLLLSQCSQKLAIVSSSDEKEIIDILSEFYLNSIKFEKRSDKSGKETILVDENDFGRAAIILREKGFPRQKIDGIDVLFKKEGMISSANEDRIRLYYGISQEITKTLIKIDGVIDSRVHIVTPDISPTDRTPPQLGAAVMIRHRGDFQGDVNKIRQLVANSVPNLPLANVSIYLFQSQQVPVQLPLSPNSEGSDINLVIIVSVIFLIIVGGIFFLRFIVTRQENIEKN